MKNRVWLVLFCIGVAGLLPARASVGSWDQVESLSPGTPISVVVHHRIHCQFQVATDETLTCSSGSRVPVQFTIPRDKVRQVALEKDNANHIVAGALVGAGTGATLGALHPNDRPGREGAALLLGGIGAVIGGAVGKAIPAKSAAVLYEP